MAWSQSVGHRKPVVRMRVLRHRGKLLWGRKAYLAAGFALPTKIVGPMTEFSLAIGLILLYIGLERRLSRIEKNITDNIAHLRKSVDRH